MDTRMPIMGGYEAIKRIRECVEGKETKIVSVTASAFGKDREKAIEKQKLLVRHDRDALSLADDQTATFFKIESRTRSASAAESLGLSPVVAYQILSAFGGEMKLVKKDEKTGYLDVVLLKEQEDEPSSDLS